MHTHFARLSLTSLMLLALAACGTPTDPNTTHPSPTPSTSPSNSPTPSASPTTTPSTTPSSTPAAGDGFAFVGLDADKVMSGALVQSDKVNDLHFSYTHTFSSAAEVESIQILKSVNGFVNPGIGWSSKSASLWVLGAEANGKALNQSYATSLGSFSGTVRFDFYGSQSGVETYRLADPGTEFTLEIKLKGQADPLRVKTTL